MINAGLRLYLENWKNCKYLGFDKLGKKAGKTWFLGNFEKKKLAKTQILKNILKKPGNALNF